MFYGLLNLPVLVHKFIPLYRESGETEDALRLRVEQDLRARAVALTAEGWCRTFGKDYATIQRQEGHQLKTYGVYLTPLEVQLCDQEEDLDQGYYEKIVIPVLQVGQDGAKKPLQAFVYRMTAQREIIEASLEGIHNDDGYLDHCIRTDLHHLELTGNLALLQDAEVNGWQIEVRRINSFELIRTY